MEKTFEKFKLFTKSTDQELKDKYLSKLENKYKEYMQFEDRVRFRTEVDGVFSVFLDYIRYFCKYLTKIYELEPDENSNIFETTRKYFKEIIKAMNIFKEMNSISSIYIYDVRKIYVFYNRFCHWYNKQKEYFGWKETGNMLE